MLKGRLIFKHKDEILDERRSELTKEKERARYKENFKRATEKQRCTWRTCNCMVTNRARYEENPRASEPSGNMKTPNPSGLPSGLGT